jgi:hypothetical protein
MRNSSVSTGNKLRAGRPRENIFFFSPVRPSSPLMNGDGNSLAQRLRVSGTYYQLPQMSSLRTQGYNLFFYLEVLTMPITELT